MACLRLKPTSDAPLPQGLPTKIIRLHRSGRQAKAHISMKPDDFRRQFPELAEGRCAFSGAWSPLPRWRKRRCAARGTCAPARRLYRTNPRPSRRVAVRRRSPQVDTLFLKTHHLLSFWTCPPRKAHLNKLAASKRQAQTADVAAVNLPLFAESKANQRCGKTETK